MGYKLVVDVDGVVFTVVDGVLSGGTKEDREKIELSIFVDDKVRLYYPFGDLISPALEKDNPVGALAALATLSSRWKIIGDLPKELERFFEEQRKYYREGDDLGESIRVF